jgi:hypothetical protein
VQAWSQIRSLEARLAAIKTPQAATRLRSLTLQLIGGQASMTHEVAELVGFLPRFEAALVPLGPETTRLERVLSEQQASGPAGVAAVYAAKAAALLHFQAEMSTVIKQLRRLPAPAVSRPGYEAQIAALQGMGTSAGELAQALTRGATSSVGPLLVSFDRSATLNQQVSVQRAEIAAIRAYDTRAEKLQALAAQVQQERTRLANTLH